MSSSRLDVDVPPPWSLEGEAIVTVTRPRASSPAASLPLPSLVVATRYVTSPVGPYLELALAEPAQRGACLGLTVRAMVVDSPASEAAGRRNWGFPKEVRALSWTSDGEARGLAWEDGGVLVTASPRAAPSVPVVVPLRVLQEREGDTVVVPARLRAKARFAAVAIEAGPASVFHSTTGTRPGVLLTDLHLLVGPPSR